MGLRERIEAQREGRPIPPPDPNPGPVVPPVAVRDPEPAWRRRAREGLGRARVDQQSYR